MKIDRTDWSGEGDFTATLLTVLEGLEQLAIVKVQDTPVSRSDAGFSYIGNDVFVGFRRQRAFGITRLLGVLPLPAIVTRKCMTLEGLAAALGAREEVGEPDYADADMLQYLKAERVIPPYQTRGRKIVEVVRIFEATPL